MQRYLIISPDPDLSHSLSRYLYRYASLFKSLGQSLSCTQAIENVELLQADLIFIDSDSTDYCINNFLTRYRNHDSKIVVISNDDSYAIKAYQSGAYDFILKSNFSHSVDRMINRILAENPYVNSSLIPEYTDVSHNKIIIKTSEGYLFLEVDDIVRVQADGSYCSVYLTDNTKKTISKPLSYIEKQLERSNYFRTHHSHLVNLNYISILSFEDGGYVQMRDGSHVPIARRRKNDLISQITQRA